jgi:hypothetical protein
MQLPEGQKVTGNPDFHKEHPYRRTRLPTWSLRVCRTMMLEKQQRRPVLCSRFCEEAERVIRTLVCYVGQQGVGNRGTHAYELKPDEAG